METNVTRFLVGGVDGKGTAPDAKALTKSIIAVNNSFLQTRMLTRATIFNGISKDQTLRDQVRARRMISPMRTDGYRFLTHPQPYFALLMK